MVDLFDSATTNTCTQIVMLFLVMLFLKDTVFIYNEYIKQCGHKWSIFYCFNKKKLMFSYVNIFYGPVNYVHILFLFCFLFRWIILIHGSLAPIMHFYIIDNNTVYRYVNSRYDLIILYVFQRITFINNYSSLIISCT